MREPSAKLNSVPRIRRTSAAALVAATVCALPLAAAVASTAAASTGADPTPPPTQLAGSSTLKHIDPAALQGMLGRSARELMVPGALILLRTPQGDFTATYGTTKLGAANPPTADTQFRIASNTKTMTAAVIMLLAQDGQLGLDDPVSKYVADVPGGNSLSIAQLMEMRSGLFNYTDAPELWASLDREPAKAWSPAELLAMALARPATVAPGTTYLYNNTNYVLLGLVAEKVAGKPLAELMQERLFAPLGMRHTLLPASTVTTLPDPYAHGYGYGSSSIVLSDDAPEPPGLQSAIRAGTLAPTDYTFLNPSFAAAAGGVISTANDLAVWIRALVGGAVLNAAYQRRWLDSLQPEDPNKPDGQAYGYGISALRWGPNALYFHGGETPGYNSKIAYDPRNRTTLIVWTNLALSPDGQQPANTLMVNVLDQIYQLSPLAPPPPPN